MRTIIIASVEVEQYSFEKCLTFFIVTLYYNLCRGCLNYNEIFPIRKTDFSLIIKGYWYTKVYFASKLGLIIKYYDLIVILEKI